MRAWLQRITQDKDANRIRKKVEDTEKLDLAPTALCSILFFVAFSIFLCYTGKKLQNVSGQ